jgi:AcrR family transcriptional regulator
MPRIAPRSFETSEYDARRGQAELQPRARATRSAILTAAAEHFARHGYHATSLDRVLADSGGTKGALYFHFASKRALARAVIAEMVQQWGDLRGQVGDRGLDPLSALLVLVDEVITRLVENPIARGGTRLLSELREHPPEAGEHYAFGERDALALLTEAVRCGQLRAGVEPEGVARQIVAMVAGHRQICDVLDNRGDLWRRMDEAWELILPAIATEDWLTQWRSSQWSSRPRPHGERSPGDTGGLRGE